MGFVGALFGGDSGNEGDAGINYKAGTAGIDRPVTTGDAISANNQAQDAYTQQQAFVNALAGQNGTLQQSNILNQLNAQGGIGNQNQVFASEQDLGNQIQNVINGGGPNPAQAALNQNTGNNIATQAALMAGQRGAGANAGLIARQAAQQGATTQQQAVGQAATLQAQQQLGAIAAKQAQQAQMAQLANNQVGNQIGLGNQIVAQQAAGTNALNSNAQGLQANALGQINSQNNAEVSSTSSQNSANSGVAQNVAGQQGKLAGGIINGIGGAIGMAKGGVVPRYADGGEIAQNVGTVAAGPKVGGPMSKVGQSLASTLDPASKSQPDPLEQGGNKIGSGIGQGLSGLLGGGAEAGEAGAASEALPAAALLAAKGGPVSRTNKGKVDAMVSPGEVYLPPQKVAKVAKTGESGGQILKEGQKIKGNAKVPGDSYANDTVPKKLEAGGIVLPRHVTQSKNPGKEAEKFVNAVLARQGLKR